MNCQHPTTRQILVDGKSTALAFCPDCGAPLEPACTHPPDRQFAWLARDDTAAGGMVLCVACCECGAVLQGAATVDEAEP